MKDVAADKGYHSNQQITNCTAIGLRTYVAEPKLTTRRRWTDKADEVRTAVLNNRRRTQRQKGRRLQRLRSERVERSFAHVCDTGGARRTWLRGLEKINKRYSMVVAAHNLGLVMRKLFGSGKPRQFTASGAFASAICWIPAVVGIFRHMVLAVSDRFVLSQAINQRDFRRSHQTTSLCFSTDC